VIRNNYDIILKSKSKVARVKFNESQEAIKVLVIPHDPQTRKWTERVESVEIIDRKEHGYWMDKVSLPLFIFNIE